MAIGRGNNAGPAADAFPLSVALPSSPGILITGTTAAAQTTAHVADAKAYDLPYIIISNVGASPVTVYGQLGSTATTGQRAWTVSAGAFTTAYSFDVPISNSGVVGFWSTATAGVYVTGYVYRIFTAST
jgi:hypothetical protein